MTLDVGCLSDNNQIIEYEFPVLTVIFVFLAFSLVSVVV